MGYLTTNTRNIEERYEGNNTPLGNYTDHGQEGSGQYNGQGVYCGLSTASEVFRIFTFLHFFSVFVHLHYLVTS